MADWDDIARDSLKAAQLFADGNHFRSCASRAYYAAFSAVSFALQSQAPFERWRETPAHRMVTRLVEVHLAESLTRRGLRELKARITRLYNERINADYKSGLTVDMSTALQSQQDAHSVCRALGVIDAPRS